MSDAVEILAERARRAMRVSSLGHDEIPRRGPGARPLSFQQERLWFLEQLEPGTPVYNVGRALRIDGLLDTTALRSAVAAVVDRHETLRTEIRVVNETPQQLVIERPGSPLEVESVEDVAPAAREAEALARVRAEARRPFDLARAPLARFLLIRVSPEHHFLVLTAHHIVSDAQSIAILLRDLSELYRSFATGSAALLPALEVQYGDYAAWQREVVTEASLEKTLSAAVRKLSGAPPVLELPTDLPRPLRPSFRGGRVEIPIAAGDVERLRILGRRAGATLFMTLLAAFDTLLARHAGRDDVVIGTPIAGRGRSEVEDLVGFFVNMLVLRTDLSGDPTVTELVSRVREGALEAFDLEDVPFERLVEVLRPERHMSHAPVFQVMFNFHGTGTPAPALPGLSVAFEPVENGTSQFDLTLIATESGGGVACVFVYNADLFERATVERMAARYRTIVREFGRHPEKRLSAVEMLDPAERAALLRESGPPPEEDSEESTAPRLFLAAKPRAGGAIECAGESWTTAQLERAASSVAFHLRNRGVGEGSIVGVRLDRSVRLPAAILGIWKAGAAYVPVDPDWPPARTEAILADAGAVLVVGERGQGASARLGDRDVLLIEDLVAAEGPEPAAERGQPPSRVAYVLYTSGSTGRPKGVVVEHGSLANVLESLRREPGVGTGDVWLSVTSPVFDISIAELFLPLIAGARLVIASREEAADPGALERRIHESGATIMQATPATWQMLVAHGWEGKRDLRILSGGEALPWELAEELGRRSREVWNLYGPTETTIWSTIERVHGRSPTRFVPIGRPVARTSLYIVDDRSRLVPDGIPGELAIGGAGLARGYQGMPEETASRFVANPFGPGRLYHTGDRVRRLADGRLEFLGRFDDQVKLRGYRIEPAEIEAVVSSHPSVRHAVVVAVGEGESRRLVAFVVGRGQTEVPDLAAALRSRLPEPMVPAEIRFVEWLPRTSGGKVDRQALAALSRVRRGEGSSEPKDETQSIVARVWREVLRLDRVGIDQNFFDLGGHSLLATRVLARLRDAFAIELPLRLLFEKPTVAGLAAEIARRAGGREESGANR